jgi:hypothetical protein
LWVQARQVKPAVHTGFMLRSQDLPVEDLWAAATSNNKRLVMCGHSLGGAVAMLGTLRLLQSSGAAAQQQEAQPAEADGACSSSSSRSSSSGAASGSGRRQASAPARAASRLAQAAHGEQSLLRCVTFAAPPFSNQAFAKVVSEAGWDKLMLVSGRCHSLLRGRLPCILPASPLPPTIPSPCPRDALPRTLRPPPPTHTQFHRDAAAAARPGPGARPQTQIPTPTRATP